MECKLLILCIGLIVLTKGKSLPDSCPVTPPSEIPTSGFYNVITVAPFSKINSSNIFTGSVKQLHGAELLLKNGKVDLLLQIIAVYGESRYISNNNVTWVSEEAPDPVVAVNSLHKNIDLDDVVWHGLFTETIKLWTMDGLLAVYSCREADGQHEEAVLLAAQQRVYNISDQFINRCKKLVRNVTGLVHIHQFIEWPKMDELSRRGKVASPFYYPESTKEENTQISSGFNYGYLGLLALPGVLLIAYFVGIFGKNRVSSIA